MDAAHPDQTIPREVPGSTATGPASVQADVNHRSQLNGEESRPDNPKVSTSNKPSLKRRRKAGLLLSISRRLATLAVTLVAVLVSIVTWDLYVTAPWTRDGRIRVQVASVAPEVSGKITMLRVVDNQFVRKGDIVYQIDPFDFDVTLRTNKAVLEQREADLHVKELQSERRRRLSDLATTPEEQQVFEGSAIQANAAVDAAQQQVAQANINLQRTQVRSPVNGYVTNLLLREGDYAHQGVSNVSIIDTDSFWVDGYFEETKLARICVGNRAEAKLMGYVMPIVGHVTTVTRGVSVSNAVAGAQGLPNVDPVYTWVRLAQRVPVRIAIDEVPPGVPLVSGTTATVTIRDASQVDNRTWFERATSVVMTSLSDLVNGVSSRPGCIPVRV
jgi:RND family efflux transporter MFP subunit